MLEISKMNYKIILDYYSLENKIAVYKKKFKMNFIIGDEIIKKIAF